MSAMRKLWSDPAFLDAIQKGQASGAMALAPESQPPPPVSETGTMSAAPADSESLPNASAPLNAGPQKGAARAGAAASKKSPTLTISTSSGATQLLANTWESFKATLTLLNGTTKDVTGEVTWAPSVSGISISPAGNAEIKAAPGKVTITATHAATGATGAITVTVVARILRKITISPKNPMLELGQWEPLKAEGEFSDYKTEDVTDKVTWESRNEKVVRVTVDGHCITKEPGNADIWAYDPDTKVIDTIKLTVTAAGKAPKLVKLSVTPLDPPPITDFTPLQFTAMGDFADKTSHEVTDRVRWVSTKPDTLAINERTGLATPGLVADTAWITAVDDATAVNARSEVTVNVPKLESIEIAPRDPSVAKGETVDITVTGTFSNGTTKDVTETITWSTSNKDVARVIPVNQIIGMSEGPAEISAAVPNFPDVGDSINVTVLPAIVTSIEITPGDTTLQVSGKQTFTATAVFSDGSREVLTGKVVKWSSDDEKAVFIDQKGEATAKGPGTATITATHRASGRSGIIIVTVEQ